MEKLKVKLNLKIKYCLQFLTEEQFMISVIYQRQMNGKIGWIFAIKMS